MLYAKKSLRDLMRIFSESSFLRTTIKLKQLTLQKLQNVEDLNGTRVEIHDDWKPACINETSGLGHNVPHSIIVPSKVN